MTPRRVVLYAALAYIAACAPILWAANRADYRRGWHQRPSSPRCLP